MTHLISLAHPYWSTFSRPNYPTHRAALSNFEGSGHVTTSASVFQLHFGPAIRAFGAFKHEVTGSPQMSVCRKESCVILAKD